MICLKNTGFFLTAIKRFSISIVGGFWILFVLLACGIFVVLRIEEELLCIMQGTELE